MGKEKAIGLPEVVPGAIDKPDWKVTDANEPLYEFLAVARFVEAKEKPFDYKFESILEV